MWRRLWGEIWYLLFYLSCGLLAALAQALVSPNSGVPMVGASGAISGVIASYLLLYPRANVRGFLLVHYFNWHNLYPRVFGIGVGGSYNKS